MWNGLEARVAGQIPDEQGRGKKAKTEEEEKIAELAAFLEKAQKMVDSYRKFFITFAKDASLQFTFADGFSINYETGQVNLDASWFAKRNFSPDQILWAVLHELSHFRDMAQDEVGMKENFDYIIQKARQTGTAIEAKWRQTVGDNPEAQAAMGRKKQVGSNPNNKLTPAEIAAYQIHHLFYNILDDIFVNRLVARVAPKFAAGGRGGSEVERLYRENLFAQGDYTSLPRHLQFLYKLIREEMVPGEEAAVGEEVADALRKKITFIGAEYTPKQIMDVFLRASSGGENKAGKRHKILRRTLEPVFLELLRKDLEEWQPSQPPPEQENNTPGQNKSQPAGGEGQGGEGGQSEGRESGEAGGQPGGARPSSGQGEKGGRESSGQPANESPGLPKGKTGTGGEQEKKPSALPSDLNPFVEHYKQFKENNIDQIDENEARAWQEHKQKAQARAGKESGGKGGDKGKGKGGEKGAGRGIGGGGAFSEEWLEQNHINPEIYRQFLEMRRSVEPYLDELAQLWQSIVYGSTRGVEQGLEGHFKTGSELDVGEAVERWSEIASGAVDRVEIMKKVTSKEVLVKRPELIRVRILGDLSGSMYDSGGEKMKILRQCFVLILVSLQEFNTYLNLTRSQTKSKLKVDTEAWIFASDAVKIKPFRSEETGPAQEMPEIINAAKVFQELMLNQGESIGGGTSDDRALDRIMHTLSADEKQKIAGGKILEIIFEITDGATSNVPRSRGLIDKLTETGVIARAFQIGDVFDGEKQIFDSIWNDGRPERLGEEVPDISKLIPAVAALLRKFMGRVRL